MSKVKQLRFILKFEDKEKTPYERVCDIVRKQIAYWKNSLPDLLRDAFVERIAEDLDDILSWEDIDEWAALDEDPDGRINDMIDAALKTCKWE